MRRYGTPAKEAAELSIQYLEYQKRNIEQLENSILITYEELTEETECVKHNLIQFLPELADINTNLKFNAHNLRGEKSMSITNLNQEKIDKIKANDLLVINSVFEKHKELLNFFNYTII